MLIEVEVGWILVLFGGLDEVGRAGFHSLVYKLNSLNQKLDFYPVIGSCHGKFDGFQCVLDVINNRDEHVLKTAKLVKLHRGWLMHG